jgi:uncharacterized protein (DUF1810 family)
MSDLHNLRRFVDAQDPVFEHVIAELKAGHKQRHWMWFVFPQLQGLGSSSMTQRYSISSQAEAEAYMAHPILGPRLIECTRLVNLIEGRTAEQIFGLIDATKFRSSMTLFCQVAETNGVFVEALSKYFEGRADPLTLARL